MLLRSFHNNRKSFGSGSDRHIEKVLSFGYTDVLDYGCGKGYLEIPGIHRYDPGIPEYTKQPEPHDMLVCTDVLEHVEPELLDNVLSHMKSLMRKEGYLTIGCSPAQKKLPDGRNAHLLIMPPEKWIEKLKEYFEVTFYDIYQDPNKELESIELLVHIKPK